MNALAKLWARFMRREPMPAPSPWANCDAPPLHSVTRLGSLDGVRTPRI
jgi:hypothetical protein